MEIVDTHEPQPIPGNCPVDTEATEARNKANAVISNIAAALQAQGSRYNKLYRSKWPDGTPHGLYAILADTEQPPEQRPGLVFRLNEANNPARLVVGGTWPEYHYTTPATFDPRPEYRVFRANYDSITISATREPKKLAKEITRRFLAAYEPKHEEQLYLMSKFASNIDANREMSKAIAEEFPGSHNTKHDGSTAAWAQIGKHDFRLQVSPYDQRILLTVDRLTLEQVRQVRALLQHF